MWDGKQFCLRRNTVNTHDAEVVNSVNRENGKRVLWRQDHGRSCQWMK